MQTNRTIFEPKQPTTQSVEAVKQLIAFYNHNEEPAEMPAFYRLSGEMVLVLSIKKDSYYVVTEKACSCPSFMHRGGPCKHQKSYFGKSNPNRQTLAETLEEADRNLSKMPASYQRMVRIAREQAETSDEEILAEPQNIVRCKPISDEERAAKIAAAKARSEANRQATKERQERIRLCREQNTDSFKPIEEAA